MSSVPTLNLNLNLHPNRNRDFNLSPHKFIVELTICLLVSAHLTFSEAPTLNHLYPAGAAPGASVTVSLSGKFEPWPPKIWISEPGLAITTDTNKGKLHIRVSRRAAPGPRLLRLFNNEGASEPRMFIVGDGAELADEEPNNHFTKPQTLTNLPVTINGRLDRNGDADSFAVHLQSGQWLDARLDAYTLMSKFDGVLRLVDTTGNQIDWNHDWSTLDPRLVWKAPREQTVVLQVFGFKYPANAEIQLSGGEDSVYRLHVTATANPPAELCEPLSDKEPNDLGSAAQPLTIPVKITGSVCGVHDEDRFSFTAKKDQVYEAAIEAAVIGSPLDAWLKIEDTSAKELARNDDDAQESRDPKLEWKAPSDGSFVLALGSVTHRGGDSFRYRLRLRELQPAVDASIAASSFVLTAGSTNELKFKITRLRGCTNDLVASVHNLPDGVFASAVRVPDKSGDVSLNLIAETNAPPFSGPIQLILSDSTTQEHRPVPTWFTSRTTDNGVPGGYTRLLVENTDQLWLTVRPKPAEPKPAEKK